MQKILLAGESLETSRSIKETLESHLPYQIFTANDSLALAKQLDSRVFNLLIMDTRFFNTEDYQSVLEMREEGCTHAPILYIADKLQIPHDYYSNETINLHFLTRPFSDKNLLGISRKLLAQKAIPKQVHRRFNTNQIAQIETLSDGECLLTSMYNLSKGGAYCEFDGGKQMAIGDLVRLKIILSETNSEHNVSAKVVWTTQRGRFSGRHGLGMRFLSSRDSYREMMEKL